MRRCNVLLLTVFSLLASCGTLASGAVDKRSLRVAKLTDNEERVIPALNKWAKTTLWLESGKSTGYVRSTLGLNGLSGAALKSAPNYQYYEHFLHVLEGRKLKDMLAKGDSPGTIWTANKLDDVLPAQLKDSNRFKTYARYANMYDDEMIKLRNNNKAVKLEFGGSAAEKNAKVDIWVSADRPSYYVKEVLNLDRRSRNALRGSENYPYYVKYLDGIEGHKMEKWLSAGVTTDRIWASYGLGKLSDAALKKSQAFKWYVDYATKHDDEMFKLFRSGKEVKVSSEFTPAEMNAKVKIWASTDRPFGYVEKMLGLDKTALKSSPNYPFYEKFVKLTNV